MRSCILPLVVPIVLLMSSSLCAQENIAKKDTTTHKKTAKQKAEKILNKTLHIISLLNYSDRTFDRTFSGIEAYKSYEGKEIERIDVDILPPFGVSIEKPTTTQFTKFQKFANRIQFNTKERIVRNDLLFNEGEKLIAQKFTDTEKNMWHDGIYKDLRILVLPSEDTSKVIVKVTVQQRWSWSVSTSARFDQAVLGIEFKNIGGFPQRLTQQVAANYRKDNPYSIYGEYEYINIRRSRINVYGEYIYQLLEKGAKVEVSRNFYSSESRWAAHFFTGLYRNEAVVPNLLADAIPGRTFYNFQDIWAAYALPLEAQDKKGDIRKIVFAARYYRQNYTQRPFSISNDGSIRFLNRHYVLGSIGYATWNYFQDREVFLNGGSEYFPLGLNFSLTFGTDYDEKYGARFYHNFRASYAAAIPKLFYFTTGVSIGSYFNGNEFQQKLFRYHLRMFTNKVHFGKKIFFRQFLHFRANIGYDRPKDRLLILNDNNGMRGVFTSQFSASKIYSLTLESVLYGNFKVLGFTGSVAVFADLGWLQNEQPHQIKAIQGIGASLRLRNLSFGIGYFDFSVVFYPHLLQTTQKPYAAMLTPEMLKGIYQENLFEYKSLEPEY